MARPSIGLEPRVSIDQQILRGLRWRWLLPPVVSRVFASSTTWRCSRRSDAVQRDGHWISIARRRGYLVSGPVRCGPDKAGDVSNLVTDSGTYGAWSQYFNGLDVTVSTRAWTGFTFVGGMSIGQTVADSCDVRAHLPELATTTMGTSAFGAGLAGSAVTPLSPYCHVAYGFLPQFRGLTSYVVPRADLQLSATFQSKPGAMLAANYVVPSSVVAPELGRNLSGSAPNVTVNLVAPGTMYGDRINELDVRAGKILRHGRSRTLIAVDIYNVLNSSAVLAYNSAFVPNGTWLQPMTILTPRLFKITAEFDF